MSTQPINQSFQTVSNKQVTFASEDTVRKTTISEYGEQFMYPEDTYDITKIRHDSFLWYEDGMFYEKAYNRFAFSDLLDSVPIRSMTYLRKNELQCLPFLLKEGKCYAIQRQIMEGLVAGYTAYEIKSVNAIQHIIVGKDVNI